mmetsp:Transcript_70765/g.127492  ORF Transcript_70765/g.127492 Transcript_70765/m.127492 type:complete len:254 (+) Transcript_70765:61-822(+)
MATAAGHAVEPPHAVLVVLLARADWVPAELRGDSESGREDYCVCLFESPEGDGSTFPGGRVHSMDHALASGSFGAEGSTEDPLSLALRVAAAREVFTEAGIVLAAPAPPPVLREATRQILQREGPRVFLDCLIAWDGGNPNPVLTLCPLEELSVSGMPLEGASSPAPHVFITEVPDAEELNWAKTSTGAGGKIQWLKPSEILRGGRIQLPPLEHLIIFRLCERLSRLVDLPMLIADWQDTGGELSSKAMSSRL